MLYRLPIAFGKNMIHYNSVEISCDEDVSIMFDCCTQFLEISIMELFIVARELILSSRGSAPDPASIALSLPECSPTLERKC